MARRKAFYWCSVADRVGEYTMRIHSIRNLYPESEYDLTIILPRNPEPPYANIEVLKVVCRGLKTEYYDTIQDVCDIYNKAQGQDPTAVWVDPDPVAYIKLLFNRSGDWPRTHHCTLTDDDLERGRKLREKLGIPLDARIVTFHVRESGYLPEQKHQKFRDVDVETYYSTLLFLVKLGYWIIRLGNKTMKKIPELSQQIIDAPFHPDYEPFFEPYFIGCSHFYFGSPSGPSVLAEAFAVPQLITNYPVHACARESAGDIYIYKKYFSKHLERTLTYEEVITSPLVHISYAHLYDLTDVVLMANTPEEILGGAWEMHHILDGTYPYVKEAIRVQRQVKAIQRKAHVLRKGLYTMDEEPYTPWFASYLAKARVSLEFIRLNPSFLGHPWPDRKGWSKKTTFESPLQSILYRRLSNQQ